MPLGVSRGYYKPRVKTKWPPTLARWAQVLKPALVGQRHFLTESVVFRANGPAVFLARGEAPGNGYPKNQRANGPIVNQIAGPLALRRFTDLATWAFDPG